MSLVRERLHLKGCAVELKAVWFTLKETETEISINGKILIPLTKTKKLRKTEMEKFDLETYKLG